MTVFDGGTVADYLAFLKRRLRFIVVGTAGVVAVMAAVTSALPRVYTTWAVIDAGTLGERLGLDPYRNRFNDGAYLEQITNFPPGSVRRAWMLFASPKVMIRVDAVDGPTAAAAASQLARHTVSDLSGIPVPSVLPGATPDQAAAVRSILRHLRDQARGHLGQLYGRIAALDGERQRLLLRVDSPTTGAGKQKEVLSQLTANLQARDALDRDALRIEQSVEDLQAAGDAPISSEAAAQLAGRDIHLPEALDEAEALLADIVNTLRARPSADVLVPVRLSQSATVPRSPDWPNLPLNLAIAFVFGLVGSTFAAVLAERDTPDVRTM